MKKSAALALAEFEIPCNGCGGEGQIESPEWSDWRTRTRGKVAEAVRAGDIPACEEFKKCPRCAGKGTFLTPTGEEMVGFIARHSSDVVDRWKDAFLAEIMKVFGATARRVIHEELVANNCPEDLAVRIAAMASGGAEKAVANV